MTTPNTLFPGRPDYTGPTSGLFGLLHHDLLVETSHNIQDRIAYVRRRKNPHEIAIRLYNMIYLGDCQAVAKLAPLDAEYFAKHAPLDAEILAYIKRHIPDCDWNGTELVFPPARPRSNLT